MGAGYVIPGFEDAVLGLEVGEAVTKLIPAKLAYGESDPSLIISVNKSEFPADLPVELNQHIQMNDGNGMTMIALVKEIGEEYVVLDGNHSLAGKDLVFEISLLEVESN